MAGSAGWANKHPGQEPLGLSGRLAEPIWLWSGAQRAPILQR